MSEILNRIAAERERQGFSYRELADKAGLQYPKVHAILNGKGNPTLESITKLADALGLELRIVKPRN